MLGVPGRRGSRAPDQLQATTEKAQAPPDKLKGGEK